MSEKQPPVHRSYAPGVSLRDHPLLYVFLEAHDLAAQRRFLESDAGLPVLETDPDPRHRHGVVKYEAGTVILALNLSPASRFVPAADEGLTMVFAGGTEPRTDPHGHRYLLGAPGQPVAELRLRVDDLGASVAFYRDVLGLECERSAATATVRTAGVPLVLEQGPSGRHDTCLLVFHTGDIRKLRDELAGRGLRYSGRDVGSKKIGWTIRFTDPSGHRLCLYEPSEAALRWDSGRAVRAILAGSR